MYKLSQFALVSLALLVVVGVRAMAADTITGAAVASNRATIDQPSANASTPQSYADAYKLTADGSKPLVVLVGASWCPACQSMKTSVMPAVAADGGLKDVVFTYVNTDQQSALAGKLMEGSMIPQLIIFQKTDQGWTTKRLVGAQSVSTVKDAVGAAAKAAIAAKMPSSERKSAASHPSTSSPQAAVIPGRSNAT